MYEHIRSCALREHGTLPDTRFTSSTFHDCARSPAVRRSQILGADRSHPDRLLVGRSPQPPACLQTTPPTISPSPHHQKYPFGHEWARVLRTVPVSRLCDLAPCPLCRPLLPAQLPSLWWACRRAWSDRPGPHVGGVNRNAAFGTLSTASRCATTMETFAVIPGFRRRS